MQITTVINNAKCVEWGIKPAQGALVDFINQAASWAAPVVIDEAVWYWVSRNKVVTELNLYYSQPDTVYRHLKDLEEKGIIRHLKRGKDDLVVLTEKGKTWNQKTSSFDKKNTSEINPNKLGNISEARKNIRINSEINPKNLGNISDKSTNQLSTNQDHINTPTSGECVSHDSAIEIIDSWEKNTFNANDLVKHFGISRLAANSWLTVRKEKKASLNPLAFKKFVKQSILSGMSLEETIQYSAERNWSGFNAAWANSGFAGQPAQLQGNAFGDNL